MENGVIEFEPSSNGHIQGKMEYTALEQNGEMRLTLRLFCRVKSEGSPAMQGDWKCTAYVNSRSMASTVNSSVSQEWTQLVEISMGIPFTDNETVIMHNIGGRITAPDSLEYQGLYTEGSMMIFLGVDAHKGLIVEVKDLTLGAVCHVKWQARSSKMYHTIRVRFGENLLSSEALQGDTSSVSTYSFTPPIEWAALLPTSTDATAEVEIISYADTDCIFDLAEDTPRTVELIVPDNDKTRPSIKMILFPENVGIHEKFSSVYIQRKSKLRAILTPEGKYGAAIVTRSITISGIGTQTVRSDETVLDAYLANSGTINITATVTDTRGFTNTLAQQIEVLPYQTPAILPPVGEERIVCRRCDDNGEYNRNGTNLRVKGILQYSSLNGLNTYSANCDLGLTAIALQADDTGLFNYTTSGFVFEPKKAYSAFFTVVDDLGGRYSITIPIVSAATDFHLAGGKAAFGKYATRANALDLAEDWDLIWKNATLDDVVAEQSDFENGYYRKWASRRCEMFLSFTAATGSDITVALPFAVTNGIVVGTASAGYITNTSLYGTELTFAVAGTENTENITVMLCIMGTY